MNLTKKVWNTLSQKTRTEIVTIYQRTPTWPPYYNEFIQYNYPHDFGYNIAGIRLKEILACCRLQEDGTIDVVTTVRPTFGGITKSKEQVEKEKAKQTKIAKAAPKKLLPVNCGEPLTYYVDYEDKDGDLCHVWVEATSVEDAENQVRHEYWDVNEIINVKKKNE